MSSRPPSLSVTVTKSCSLKSGGRKNLPLPYDLVDVMGLPLHLPFSTRRLRDCDSYLLSVAIYLSHLFVIRHQKKKTERAKTLNDLQLDNVLIWLSYTCSSLSSVQHGKLQLYQQ